MERHGVTHRSEASGMRYEEEIASLSKEGTLKAQSRHVWLSSSVQGFCISTAGEKYITAECST